MRFARNCEIALARFIPMTPLSKTMNLTLVGKGERAFKPLRSDYGSWLDPQHPRILCHYLHMTERQIPEQAAFLVINGKEIKRNVA